ncbi:MAG: hypothetical protein ACLR56_00445 [Oscillospiraceae bacterium]
MVKFLSGFKSGVMAMSQNIPGLVESSQNLGIANISAGILTPLCRCAGVNPTAPA